MKKIIILALIILAGFAIWFNQNNNQTVSHAYKDLIRVTYPAPDQEITSPLIVRGEARGNWFFEASFPIVLVDWDGRIIAESFAQAQGNPADGGVNWMTEDYVPFEGKIEFTKPVGGPEAVRGTLIFKKDNASGLPEHDDAYEIPVRFNISP